MIPSRNFFSPVLALLLLLTVGSTLSVLAQTTPANDSALTLLQEGRRMNFSHRYPEAVELCRRSLELMPHNAEAIYELAWAYFEMGEFITSTEIASEGTLYPTNLIEEIYALINDSYIRSITLAIFEQQLDQRTDEEVGQFIRNSLADTMGEGPNSLYQLGFTYYDRRDTAKALTAYTHCLSAEPSYWGAHRAIGLINDVRGRDREAALAYAFIVAGAEEYPYTVRVAAMLQNALESIDGMSDSIVIAVTDDHPRLARRLSSLASLTAPTDSLTAALYIPWLREALEKGFIPLLAYEIVRKGGGTTDQEWEKKNADRLAAYRLWADEQIGRVRPTDAVIVGGNR